MTPEYRYTLSRESFMNGPLFPSTSRRRVLWVMLNPSTAFDEEDPTQRALAAGESPPSERDPDDHTVTKCMGFSKRWGWGALNVVNLFAMRATEPKDLYKAMRSGVDVVGRENDWHIQQAATWSGEQLVVCAWGRVPNMPGIRNRIEAVTAMLCFHRRHCLGYTAAPNAQPRHPLMLGYGTPLRVHLDSAAERPGA